MSAESDRPNLPTDTLFAERANLIGDCLSQIVFGLLLLPSARCALTTMKHYRSDSSRFPPNYVYSLQLSQAVESTEELVYCLHIRLVHVCDNVHFG